MDTAQWIGEKLVLTEWRGHPEVKPVITTFKKEPPCGGLFCYWCACDGATFALGSDSQHTCIAMVETALRLTVPGKYRNTYVIWQPRNHSPTVWERWAKKWSKRTKEGTA